LKLCGDQPLRQQRINAQISALKHEMLALFGVRGRLCMDAVL
jgi:hypothetical protein